MTSTPASLPEDLDSPADVLRVAREATGRSHPRRRRPADRRGDLGRAAPTGVHRRRSHLDHPRPATPASRSPAKERPWSRSSASPSSPSRSAAPPTPGGAWSRTRSSSSTGFRGCWARVQSGDLEPWRARRIAQETLGLTREAAAFVDAQVAPFAHRIGIAALERLVAEAIARFMPDRAAEDAAKAADGRHFTIEHQQVSFNGTSQISGELDLADALDLDAAVAQGAETLKALGSAESLDVRRSQAAGQIARNQLALDLTTADGSESQPPPGGRAASAASGQTRPRRRAGHRSRGRWCSTCTSPRQRSPAPATASSWLGWRTSAKWSPPTRSSTWCANPDAQVVVKPVIDLNEHIHVEGYEVPARLREQTVLRDHTCVFPWCTRSARKADADHVIPYAEGGTTSQRQHRALVSTAPSTQDPFLLDLHDARTRLVPVVEPARLPVPPRPPRHPRCQSRPATTRGPSARRLVAVRPPVVATAFRRTELGLV